MKLLRVVVRSVNDCLTHQFWQPQMLRSFSTVSPGNGANDNRNTNSFESVEDFEHRIFGDKSGNNSKSDAFYRKLDRLGSKLNGGNRPDSMDGLDESFTTLSDGMDGKLKKAATYFEYNPEEVMQDGYSFRPDMTFWPGNTYDTKDLDLTKPAVRKPASTRQFDVTTEEVLRKADFRNVRFLANFMTEAGIIIKRSKTGISAKAQRKVAREIKTARAFGLMPFTTMGTKHFVFGKTMENRDEDFEYDRYDTVADAEDQDPLGA